MHLQPPQEALKLASWGSLLPTHVSVYAAMNMFVEGPFSKLFLDSFPVIGISTANQDNPLPKLLGIGLGDFGISGPPLVHGAI